MKIIHTMCALALTTACAYAQDKPEEEKAKTKVDTELLFLVEVPGSLSPEDFSVMKKSYYNAMQSASVIQAIQAGSTGSIAASLIFYGGSSQQIIAANWTQISDKESAQNFANTIAEATLPFTSNSTSIGNALDKGLLSFSTSAENGFESDSKIIDITGSNATTEAITKKGEEPIISSADADKAVSESVIKKGVTTINGLSIGGDKVADYYKENIVRGRDAFILTADSKNLEAAMTTKISTEINNANAAQAPEPSSVALLGLGALSLVLRRKR